MSVLDREPTSMNFLSPLGFRFNIKRSPDINYFVQAVSLPSMTLGQSFMPTPFVKLNVPGDHLDFGTIGVTFKVDEKMANYTDIYNWMMALGFPDSFDQYAALAGNKPESGKGLVSDATLIVMTSAMNPMKQIVFRDIFPIDLSPISFDARQADVNYIEATATFSIQKYEIIPA